MRNLILTHLILFVTFILGQTGWAADEQFQLFAKDGVKLTGQIDFPSSTIIKGVVILVPGTGLFDRDVEFGQSKTDKDLIFKEISKFLTAKDFAVVRFDYRGVKCNRRTMPSCSDCNNRKDENSHWVKNCIDNNIRAGVTPESIRDDIEVIYNYAVTHPKLLNQKILVFGHSEGSLNLSYLIADKRIRPHGAVFMGGLAESPQKVIHWQMTERLSSALFEFDFNSNGVVENEEVKIGHSKKVNYLHQLPVEILLSPSGSWTKGAIDAHLETSYQAVKSEALSHADNESFGGGGTNQASYRWWKMFFIDSQSVIENMVNFEGQIYYLNGSIDAQTNFLRQSDEINRVAGKFLRKPQIVKVEAVGHALGTDPIFGPLLPPSLEVIGNTCVQFLDTTEQ